MARISNSKPARIGYSMTEAAEALGVSRPYVYTLEKQGLLESFKLGRRRIITAESLEQLPARIQAKDAA